VARNEIAKVVAGEGLIENGNEGAGTLSYELKLRL